MSTTLTAFEPHDIESAYKLAKILVASKMLPRYLTTPEAVFAVIAAGRELGLPALQSTRSIHMVDGKVTLSADLTVALVKAHKDCEYFRVVEATNDRCVCETKRRGESPTVMEWTIADARRAGLDGKDNWKKYPKAMLRARVSADLCRAVFPDAAMGVYDPDELNAPEPKRSDVDTVETTPSLPEPTPAKDLQAVNAATTDNDQDEGDTALAFQARIVATTSMAELVDMMAEIKRAGLSDLYLVPLRESAATQKKNLKSAAEVSAQS